MDHPAALHRLTVGVPATVEHSAEAEDGGAEKGKWVAETTQASVYRLSSMQPTDHIRAVIYYFHGCSEAQSQSERPTSSFLDRINEWIFSVQRQPRMGR